MARHTLLFLFCLLPIAFSSRHCGRKLISTLETVCRAAPEENCDQFDDMDGDSIEAFVKTCCLHSCSYEFIRAFCCSYGIITSPHRKVHLSPKDLYEIES